MATTRDQLIADWQKRLAAASEAPDEPTSRAVWLAHLRVRLYRFLLSLYGEGDWNAPEGAPESPSSVVIDAQTLPLAGKPAKDEDAIRAVLKSVAGACENKPQAGPFAAGIEDRKSVV